MKKDTKVQMGSRIQEARNGAGVTQDPLAERVNRSVQFISDLERGVVGASVDTLMRLCEELGVSADYILFGSREYQDPEIMDLSIVVRTLPPEERNLVLSVVNRILQYLKAR